MAHFTGATDWQPSQVISNQRSSSPESPERVQDSTILSPPPSAPEAPWMGHYPQPCFAYSSTQSLSTRHASSSTIYDPIQETVTQKPQGYDHVRSESHFSYDQTSQLPPNDRPPYQYRISQWFRTHWGPAWSMYAFLLTGIAFACGHHAFYSHLHGKEANSQKKMLRYGTALAFFSKASLLTAIMLAHRQRVWMVVRQKILTLGAVDSLFAAAEDLTALFHWEVFKKAKVAMFLALYIWATPLVVILTSETLSVMPKSMEENTTCPAIQTLNFAHEDVEEWRDPSMGEDGLFQFSVSWWNSTVPDDEEMDPNNDSSFDYYISPTNQVKRVAEISRYLHRAVPQENASSQICGQGWNCSATIKFTGPGYKCQELASGVGSEVKRLGGAEAPFNTTDIVPEGDFTYNAIADMGEYDKQINSGKGGVPVAKPPYPKNLGAFRTEPVIWIGYAVKNRTDNDVPKSKNDSNWSDDAFIPKIIGCEHYETNYTVQLNYTNGVQSYKVERNFLSKVVDTRFVPGVNNGNEGLLDNTTATPQNNYVFPKDLKHYRRTAAYHSIGKQLRDTIQGSIALQGKVATTEALETRLIRRNNFLPVDNFPEELQKTYDDMILSLLSEPQFLAVSWASDTSKMVGTEPDAQSAGYPCVKQRTINCYFYYLRDLWIVYSLAVFLAIASVAVGVRSMPDEDVACDTRFSTIVAATRGQSLNAVRWNSDTDNKKLKVGFGVVPDLSGDRKYGFGLEGDVAQYQPEPATRSSLVRMREWGERSTSGFLGSKNQH